MTVRNDKVKADGIVTRDELLAMGCEEVKSQKGRIGYVVGGDVVAVECTGCTEIKKRICFGTAKRSFLDVFPRCKNCRKEYREENRNRILERKRKYREENRERIRKWNKVNRTYYHNYYDENRELIIEKVRKYYRENPEKALLKYQRRRARKLALPYDESAQQRTKVWADFGNACALTRESTDLHADHAVPLDVGHGGTTYGNMYPLNGRLNESKSASHLFEWFDANKERFGLSQRKFDALIAYLAEANDMTTQEYRKYVDWCFDNPREVNEETGELEFVDGPINERNKTKRKAIA